MGSRRKVLVLVLGLAASAAAVAESSGALRWRSGGTALGLQPAAVVPAVQCGPFSLTCDVTTVVPLYASRQATRSISMQIGASEGSTALNPARSQGLSLALVGKVGLFPDVGVYGRVGTVLARGSGFAAMPGAESGLTYGVGLSWDFSRRASAVVGFDTYDFRGLAGDARDVRATSIGLQWRY
jgi:hypothetical protein